MQNNQLDAFAKSRLESIFRRTFSTDLVKQLEATSIVKKEDGLGLELQNLVVRNVHYQSQFLGEISPGDILIKVNGQNISENAHIVKLLVAIFSGAFNNTARITLKFLRFKNRINRPASFPALKQTEGYTYETAVIYNLRPYFPIGLDVRDIDGRIVVCHTYDASLSEMCMPVGAAILDVDGEKITSCVMLEERLRKSLEIRSYALVQLEIPMHDYLKNMTRNRILGSTKDVHRNYSLPEDVRNYIWEGVSIIKAGLEPTESILVEDKTPNSPATQLSLNIEKNVVETDIPESSNTCLFVKIPPTKSFESENACGGTGG